MIRINMLVYRGKGTISIGDGKYTIQSMCGKHWMIKLLWMVIKYYANKIWRRT